MPESPRYLCLKGKDDEALSILIKIYDDQKRAIEEIKSIKESFDSDKKIVNVNNYEKNLYDSNGFKNIELKTTNGNYGKNQYECNNNGITNDEYIEDRNNQSYFGKLLSIMKDPSTRRCLLLGICLHIGQQFCGINTIMYYGATVIQMSGILRYEFLIFFYINFN